MPSHKEPHFFCTDHHRESDEFHGGKELYFHVRTLEQYHNLFSNTKEALRGEASTGYLYSKEAAKNIYEYNPEAKIIIMLRDPVSFLHSLHMQYVNETTENIRSFEAALAAEESRKASWDSLSKNVRCPSYLYYSERIKYADHVKRFLDIFPASQIKIIINEDFRRANESTYRDVLEFIGMKQPFTPNFHGVHESKAPRFSYLNQLLHNPAFKTSLYSALGSKRYTRLHKKVNQFMLKQTGRKPLNQDLRATLKQSSRPEVIRLEKLIKIPLQEKWGYK